MCLGAKHSGSTAPVSLACLPCKGRTLRFHSFFVLVVEVHFILFLSSWKMSGKQKGSDSVLLYKHCLEYSSGDLKIKKLNTI